MERMRITLPDDPEANDSGDAATAADRCRRLEEGYILVLPRTPFHLPDGDREFLLGMQHELAAAHKNIAYLPREGRVTGFRKRRRADTQRLRGILRTYSLEATRLLQVLLPPYAPFGVDYTSFRPAEEQGRALPQRARNDLLHTDAFPSRPTNGDRILRMFTNIHPTRARRWVTTDPFDVLLKRFAGAPELRLAALGRASAWQRARRGICIVARAAGAPMILRSPYDTFMLRFHNFLKRSAEVQTGRKQLWDFPPDSSWVVFTDMVPHAAVAGQFALEQTFIVARAALLQPERAPIAVLERWCGGALTEPRLRTGLAR